MTSRQSIRQAMRRERRALTPQQRQAASQALARNLSTHPLFRRSRHIALYLANDGEMELEPLLLEAWRRGKQVYLPILSPGFHNRLWFAPYEPGSRMVQNCFRILEPDIPWRKARPAWALDLVMTPLVAFDEAGNRLGMGGGFYDRTLAYLERRTHWRKPHLLGVAYEFQKYPQLPHESWDVPLHGIATEKTIYQVNTGR